MTSLPAAFSAPPPPPPGRRPPSQSTELLPKLPDEALIGVEERHEIIAVGGEAMVGGAKAGGWGQERAGGQEREGCVSHAEESGSHDVRRQRRRRQAKKDMASLGAQIERARKGRQCGARLRPTDPGARRLEKRRVPVSPPPIRPHERIDAVTRRPTLAHQQCPYMTPPLFGGARCGFTTAAAAAAGACLAAGLPKV